MHESVDCGKAVILGGSASQARARMTSEQASKSYILIRTASFEE